jgi:hypothetical protein
MRHFQKFFAGIGGMAIAWSSTLVPPASAQDGLDFNEAERMMSFNTVDLRDQLYFGLRTIPEQRPFIDQVVAKVDSGELPRAMVNVVFVWARKRNPKIPFPYFEIVMRLLAEKRGVLL